MTLKKTGDKQVEDQLQVQSVCHNEIALPPGTIQLRRVYLKTTIELQIC